MSTVKEIAERIARTRKPCKVATDEGTLYVRGLTGSERVAYFSGINTAEDTEKLVINQRLVASQLCNEDGSSVFDSVEDGLKVVMEWDVRTYVEPCVDAIMKASGLKSGAIEEAGKN